MEIVFKLASAVIHILGGRAVMVCVGQAWFSVGLFRIYHKVMTTNC